MDSSAASGETFSPQQTLRTIILSLLCWLLPFSNPVLSVTLAAGLTELIMRYAHFDFTRFRKIFTPQIFTISMDGYVGSILTQYLMNHFKTRMLNVRVDVRGGKLKFEKSTECDTVTDRHDGVDVRIVVNTSNETFQVTVGECADHVQLLHDYLMHVIRNTVVTNHVRIYQLEVSVPVRRNRRRRDDDDDDGGNISDQVEWHCVETVNTNSFQNTILTAKNERELYDDFRKFLLNEDLYGRRGWCWKRGYMLCGPPGSGKTTVIRAMANELPCCGGIYTIDMSILINHPQRAQVLQNAFRKISGISQPHVVCMEDIDKAMTGDCSYDTLMGTLINSIDGMVQNSGRVFVMTVNDERFLKRTSNKALLREGRIDVTIVFDQCTLEQVCRVLDLSFGADKDHAKWCADNNMTLRSDCMRMATLYNNIKRHVEQYDALLQLLFVSSTSPASATLASTDASAPDKVIDKVAAKVAAKVAKNLGDSDDDSDSDDDEDDNDGEDNGPMKDQQKNVEKVMFGKYYKMYQMKDGKEVLVPRFDKDYIHNAQDTYLFREPTIVFDANEKKPDLSGSFQLEYNERTMQKVRSHYRALVELHYIRMSWRNSVDVQRHIYKNLLEVTQQVLLDQQLIRIDLEKRRLLLEATKAINPDVDVDVPPSFLDADKSQQEMQQLLKTTQLLVEQPDTAPCDRAVDRIMAGERDMNLRHFMKKRNWNNLCGHFTDNSGGTDKYTFASHHIEDRHLRNIGVDADSFDQEYLHHFKYNHNRPDDDEEHDSDEDEGDDEDKKAKVLTISKDAVACGLVGVSVDDDDEDKVTLSLDL